MIKLIGGAVLDAVTDIVDKVLSDRLAPIKRRVEMLEEQVDALANKLELCHHSILFIVDELYQGKKK